MSSGRGTTKSSGGIVVKSAAAGTNGVSGILSFSTGSATSGASGKITLTSGGAAGGQSGEITMTVGVSSSIPASSKDTISRIQLCATGTFGNRCRQVLLLPFL